MEPTCPFDVLNESTQPLGQSALLHELGRWKLLPPGTPGEPEIAADVLGLRLVGGIESNPWGTYYGPFASGTRADGSEFTSPAKGDLTPDLVSIWAARARGAKHPFLSHRYADLVWDLSKMLAATRPDIEFARLAIDGVLQTLATDGVEHEVEGYKIAERAIDLSKSIRDADRVRSAEEALAEYERKHAIDNKSGTWGRAFDALVLERSSLDAPAKQRLLADMEAGLDRVSDISKPESFDPFGAEAAALRLASFYRRENRLDDVRRVLLKFRDAFVAAAKLATGMIAYAWIDRVHAQLNDQGLPKDANALEPLLREHGKRSMGEMKGVGVSFTIPREDIEAAYSALTSGSAEDALLAFADAFLPRKDDIEAQLRDLAERAPLLSRISIKKTDDQGRNVVSIGSVESDLDGRVIHEVSEHMTTSAPLVRALLSKATTGLPLTVELLMTQVRASPIFAEERYAIIEQGLRSLLDGQHLAAVHILIPQIEAGIRRLAELISVPTQRRNKQGGVDFRMLDELLRDVAPVLGEDQSLYLRVLLSDRRGWNLRNEVCHGLLLAGAFGPTMSDRVLHVFLLLGALRPAPSTDARSGE